LPLSCWRYLIERDLRGEFANKATTDTEISHRILSLQREVCMVSVTWEKPKQRNFDVIKRAGGTCRKCALFHMYNPIRRPPWTLRLDLSITTTSS